MKILKKIKTALIKKNIKRVVAKKCPNAIPRSGKEGKNRTNEDFYKLGESDWIDFQRHWEMYGVNNESCLEIGCGVGRITVQLASYFNEVHALDISDKMIEYAKRHITSSSVAFYMSKGLDVPLDDQSVCSVFSNSHVSALRFLVNSKRLFCRDFQGT